MMPLARRLAHQFRGPTEPLDDLLQVASLALVGALERFDPDRGIAFHIYAIPTITGALKRYRRDLCWSVRVPRYLKERSLRVRRELRLLSCELGRHPTPGELAARCALSEDEVLEARIAGDAYRAVALDDGDRALVPPAMAGEGLALRRVEEREALAQALRTLPRRERRIVTLRFEHASRTPRSPGASDCRARGSAACWLRRSTRLGSCSRTRADRVDAIPMARSSERPRNRAGDTALVAITRFSAPLAGSVLSRTFV